MPTVGGLIIEVAANVARLQKDVDAIRGHLGRLESTQKQYAKTSQGIFEQLKSGWVGLASKIYLAEQALHVIEKVFSSTFGKGLQAIESYKQGVISASAVTLQVMDISKYKDIGEAWKDAKKYAEGMVPVLEEVAEKTMMTGDQTQMLFTQFAKNGVLLDATNAKAVRGFESMANAVAIMTKGQGVEKQIMSEINALMEGQARQGATIYDMLEKQIPNLKEQMVIWKEQGTVFENLLPYLKGFDAASGEIRLTWEATKTTLKTTVDRILREGMISTFEELVELAHKFDDWVKSHQDILQSGIHKSWLAIKGIIESIGVIFSEMGPTLKILGQLTAIIVEGWGLLFAVYLPVLTKQFKTIVEGLQYTAEYLGHIGRAIYKMTFEFDMKGAMGALQDAGAAMGDAGKSFAALFTTNWNAELIKRFSDWNKKFAIGTGEIIKPPDTAQIKDYADDLMKLSEKIELINLSSFDKQRKELEKEITDLRKKLGDEPLIQEYFDLKMAKIQSQELEKIFEKTKQQTLKILEDDEKAAKKRLEYLNQYRTFLVSTYDYAIAKAQEYYKTSVDLEGKIAYGKSFMAGLNAGPTTIWEQMDKEKKVIAEMVKGEGINIFDTTNTFETMEVIEKFLDKYKGTQDVLGFDIDFGGIKHDYEDLISKLEVTKNSTEQAGNAWTEYANQQATAIQTVDSWIQYLQAKIAEMDAQIATVREIQIDTSSATAQVQNLISLIAQLNAMSSMFAPIPTAAIGEASTGGSNFEYTSYATGTNYVPRTGMYKLHQGEAVIPANQNNQTNNFSPTIVVQGGNGQSIAKEIDKELAMMWQYNRSQLKRAMA